jgi:phage/plasmid-associated DNA primase
MEHQANRDRLRVFFFDARYRNPKEKETDELADPKILQNLKNKYASEVFSWLVDGAYEYFVNKKLEPPQEILKRTFELFGSKNTLKNFFDAYVRKSKNYTGVRQQEVFLAYQKYCESQGEVPKSIKLFREYVVLQDYTQSQSKGVFYIRNIELLDMDEEEDLFHEDEGMFNEEPVRNEKKPIRKEKGKGKYIKGTDKAINCKLSDKVKIIFE